MKKISTLMKAISIALLSGLTTLHIANAQSFTEDFEDITTLPASGWETFNMSNPLGATGWFQGDPATIVPFSNAGYIAANYQNTTATGVGTISNWLLSPTLTLNNGDSISFYLTTIDSATQAANGGPWADRLQLLLSTNGS